MDNGKYGLTFASGLGATTTIVSLLSAGDHMLVTDDHYGGTSRLLRTVTARTGVTPEFIDACDLALLERSIKPNTKMVWIETPTNPLMKVIDIEAVCKVAHDKQPGVSASGAVVKIRGIYVDVVSPLQIIVVVDNTFLSAYFQRPLELGADITMYSLTKYMNGHSDVIMGAAVVRDEELHNRLRFLQNGKSAERDDSAESFC